MSQVELDLKDWAVAKVLISLALAEDLGAEGDLTTQAMISPEQLGQVGIVCRKGGVICGLPFVAEVFRQMGSSATFTPLLIDGARVNAQQTIGFVNGPVKDLLTAERTCLNFLTHLSGIATLTSLFVELLQGTKAAILDTRKTHPGYRRLEKYAVRAGGGMNHRMGLYDVIMVKDNHRDAWHADLKQRSLSEAILHIRSKHAGTMLIVEVDTLDQFKEVLPINPDVILLDNMGIQTLNEAVAIRNGVNSRVLLEASGGVSLETVKSIGETGVDRISVGALTHSAPALDIGFDWEFTQ